MALPIQNNMPWGLNCYAPQVALRRSNAVAQPAHLPAYMRDRHRPYPHDNKRVVGPW